MTTIADHRGVPQRGIRGAQLALALVIGATVGSAATLQLTRPVATGPAAVTSNGDASTTTAGEQYRAWYSPTRDLAGSTSAGRQYSDWYTGGNGDTSTTAGEQYRAWYVDANERR